MQGAGTSRVIAVGMRQQQAADGVARDTRPVDLIEDWLDVAARARVDDDCLIAVVHEIDVAIEGVGQGEPHLPAPDQLDVVRQLHDRVLPPPYSAAR